MSVKILLAGDFCPINRTKEAIMKNGAKEMAIEVAPITKGSDISLVNLEAPLTNSTNKIKKTGPNLKGDPKSVEFINEGGFSAVNLANNHIKDFGHDGVLETMSILEKNNIKYCGAGSSINSINNPLIFNVRDKKIAFLSYAENEFSIADDITAGAAPINIIDNLNEIKKVSDNNDITIVLIHGGNEYCPIPSPSVIKRYRAYVDAGASAVAATHTHCPQGIEVYKGVPIIYGMGNFLFDTPYTDQEYRDDDLWWKGYMVSLTISDDTAYEVIPVSFGRDGTRVKVLKGNNRDRFLRYLKKISDIIEDEQEIENIWKAWCVKNGKWWLDIFRDPTKNVLAIRNGFTCEAHNEVLKTFFDLKAKGQTGKWEKYMDRIENFLCI